MLGLAVDVASPFIWAGAVVIVAGVVWVLRTAGTTGIGGIVKAELKPLHEAQEKTNRTIEDGFKETQRREREEHRLLWNAIEDLRKR